MVNKNVNTASTVGTQDGTTNTPGSSGTAAYATLKQALDAIGASTSDAWTINCSGTAADTQSCTQTVLDMQTSAANYIYIKGDNTTGKWNTSAYRMELSDTDGIYNNNASHVRIENLQIQITVTTSGVSDYSCFRLATANNNVTPVDHRYIGCIARVIAYGTDNGLGFTDSDPAGTGGTCRRINCVVFGNGYCGFNSDEGTWAASNCINYNCTAHGQEFPILGAQVCTNCLAFGNITGDGFDFSSMGAATQSHNTSGDSSATGTGSRINQTVLCVNPEGGDLHLLSTDASCIGFGVDDPGSGLYSTDMDGQSRVSTWDIGADEYIAATCAITGTATASITEADIVAGGKTIIATLTGGEYVPAVEIVYVGKQSGSFAGTTTAQDITFDLIGGCAKVPDAGDLVVAAYAVGSTADRSLAIRNTSATDYTLAGTELYQDDTFDCNLRVAYRFMPGTPETAIRFTETVSGGTGNAADAGTYTIHVFRFVDATTPMDVTVVTAGNINSRTVDPGSITPTTTGAWIYVAGAGAGGTGGTYTSSYLNGFTAVTRVDTNDSFMGAGYIRWTSGAYNPAAFAGGGTTTTNDSWNAVTLALRPATRFADARAAVITGLDSAQAEGTGWDAVVKAGQTVGGVVRTSSSVATITLDAFASYNITAQETITVTLPASSLLLGATSVGSPTFTVAAAGGVTTEYVGPIYEQGFGKMVGRRYV